MLTHVVVWLNAFANPLADFVLAPIALLPGGLSLTLIGVITGILMLVVFKYTSNQEALRRIRRQIKAELLALSLFQDDLRVVLRTQGRLLAGAAQLLGNSIGPVLIMALPMSLLAGQLGLWFQARPLITGEEAVVTVQVAAQAVDAVPSIEMLSVPAATVIAGPVRVPAKGMICWKIRANEAGRHELQFDCNGPRAQKELVVGERPMPTSLKRPSWSWVDALVHPRESPFPPDSPVQSIEIAYPLRVSWTSGADSWMIHWLLVSLVAAFAVRPVLNVHL